MSNGNDALSKLCSLDPDTFLKPSIEDSSLDQSTRLFFDWLESQAHPSHSQDSSSQGRTCSTEDQIREALHGISLEEEECIILQKYGMDTTPLSDDPSMSSYLPPSKLRQHEIYIQSDIALIQQETFQLRNRIAQKKAASDILTRTMKNLQRVIYDTDAQTDEAEARLLELSIKTDTTVAASIRTAEEILAILGSASADQDEKHVADEDDTGMALSTSMKQLDQIEAAVQTAIEQLQLHEKNLTLFYDKRSREAQNYKLEARLLATSFKAIFNQGKDEDSKRYWVAKELEGLCRSISDALSLQTDQGKNEALDALLFGSEMPATNSPPLLHVRDVDLEELIQTAWVEEQLSILHHQEFLLDQSVTHIQGVLKPLEALHDCLEGVAVQVQEAEGVLEAFGEEMEEVDLSFTTPTAKPIDRHGLDTKLLQTLQKFRDDGSFDALDLRSCTNEDVLDELVLLKSRIAELQVQEKGWATKGIDTLSARPVHKDLLRIYSNSLMNTSPPFAMNQTVSELQEQTQSKAAKLSETTHELEREVRESMSKSSNLKRLDAFIENWTR